jgi:hypothetical protein
MINEIGETAGKVWQYLSQHPGSTPAHIARALRVKDDLLNMAIGWLAREGKLNFELQGKTTRLTLVTE